MCATGCSTSSQDRSGMTRDELNQRKHAIRERIWTLLEHERAAPVGVRGHIPAFIGADEAASRLAALPAWQEARIVKANPDRAQLPVRVAALGAGKLLYMAVPRLATPKPFYLLDPATLTAPYDQVATGDGAARAVVTINVDDMRPVDLVVCGSVAVDRKGARLGKGAGYSDIEVGLLAEVGLIQAETTIVTTVHQLQVVEVEIPEAEHDFRVDLIVTPDEVIECGPQKRPRRLVIETLSEEQVAVIPVLAQGRIEEACGGA
jgi:5-formyltetrahydrofolate cyclo-ligase